MAKTTKRRFTVEFKREAVALWETSGRTQAEIARDLGIMPTMLRRWQRGLGVNSGKPAAQPPTSTMASPADQASEIARLRRELDRTRMERDVLKKAVVGSTSRCNGIGKGSSRGAKAKSFSRSCIEFERDPVEIVLRVALQVRAFR